MRSRSIAGARNAMQCRASHPTDLLQAFRPLPLLTNPHAQTIVATKLTFACEPPSTTQLVKLPDGDMIALEVSTPQGWQPHDPTVVMLHGLCGCHRSPYMQRLARKLLRRGLRAIRMNLRGCGSGQGLARYPYHSGQITVLCHILFAADDPLIDAHVFDGVALPANVQVICTHHGGHLGFLGLPGRAGGYRAMDAQLLAWITAQ